MPEINTSFELNADFSQRVVIKFSFIRPVVQGSRFDRDMHGAQLGVLLAEMDI